MQRRLPQSERRSRILILIMQATLIASVIIAWALWNLRRDEGADLFEGAALACLLMFEFLAVQIYSMSLSIKKKSRGERKTLSRFENLKLHLFLLPIMQILKPKDFTSHNDNKTHLDASSTHILVRKSI